ncbi:scavenger receptor cysteine-rich type 1 protein M130-like, partial [Acanthaster planci]|uniref:Scavenger receptor cysteine-rich type 1 protein M130-like n=1 Tax=Acanthaster planci TaxID=133434 RepID=A0A8B8A231_ACAPL
MDDVECVGDEKTVFECRHNRIHNCLHSEDAGVQCENGFPGELRLVAGNTHNRGRLEIFFDGEWGTICGNSWGLNESQVACWQMGFPGAIRAIQRKPYGNATGPIHLGSVRCTGLEESLDSCQHAGIGVHNCSHGQDIGIDCKSARLVDGLSSSEGRVEVYNGNAWGTICLDDWDLLDASVICRQFGFEQAVQAAEFTVPVDGQEILMTDLECVGNETTVFECQHTGPEDVRCRHQNVAGVKC